MKIKDVRVSVHRFETVLPIINRPGPAETRVICEIETDNGYAGVGMTARFLCHAVAEAVRQYVAPALKDMDPRDFEAFRARLSAILSERGVTNGVNRMALSCVDLALWDLGWTPLIFLPFVGVTIGSGVGAMILLVMRRKRGL